MKCEDFHLAAVSDDPGNLAAAERHAAGCPVCAAVLDGHRELLDRVAEWKRSTPILAPDAEDRIEATLRRELDGRPARPRGPVAWMAVAAAVLVLALALVAWSVYGTGSEPAGSDRILVARALDAARAAEVAHAEAIARLEAAAGPVLARVSDPSLAPRDAAILMAYRDRLAYLDDTIEEVQAFLDTNPGHASGRTVLLAAYREKTEVLRAILEDSGRMES